MRAYSSMRSMFFACVVFCAVAISGYYVCMVYPWIYTFDKDRDMAPIMHIFAQDHYWLVAAGDDYPVEFMIKYQTPDFDGRYFGSLKTNVLRRGGDFLGFVSYFKELEPENNSTVGTILFLGVDSKFRRQKAGDRLLRYAILELKRMGVQKVRLAVREQNAPARTLYERVGFHQVGYDEHDKVVEMEYSELATL